MFQSNESNKKRTWVRGVMGAWVFCSAPIDRLCLPARHVQLGNGVKRGRNRRVERNAPVVRGAVSGLWPWPMKVLLIMSAVFIAATDGLGGRGTATDPFDGGTQPKLDAIMRSFPEGSDITLLEGDFLTTGSFSYNETQGWYIKDGSRLRGIKGKTTLRRIAFPAEAKEHGLLQMSMYGKGNVEISDLILDENGHNLNAPSDSCSFAARLYGDNCTLRNIEAVNGWGKEPHEAFVLSICARNNGSAWENNINALIDGCRVGSFRGTYGIGIGLLGGADGHTGSVQGIVSNNTVTGFIATAAFGVGSNTVFDGNTTFDCQQSYYNDTGVCTNAVIRNGQVWNSKWPAVHLVPSMGAAQISSIIIEGMFIELSGSTPHDAGIQLWTTLGRGHLANIIIRRNRFAIRPDALLPNSCAMSAQDVNGLLIEDNILADGLVAKLYFPEHPNPAMIVRGNRTPTGAIPPGLEDLPETTTSMEEELKTIGQSLDDQAVLITAIDSEMKALRGDAAKLQQQIDLIKAKSKANLERLTATAAPPV